MKTVKEYIFEAIVKGKLKQYNNNSKFIDLGLPSGTLWANTNIGAKTPKEPGDYYAWGEIEQKETYTHNNYIYNNDTLNTSSDIVSIKLGDKYNIPTKEQFQELFDNCSMHYVTNSHFELTSKINGNIIIFPISGFFNEHYTPQEFITGKQDRQSLLWTSTSDNKWHAFPCAFFCQFLSS